MHPKRGIFWVLQWFCAAMSLLMGAATLTEFGYFLAAEMELSKAARAAVYEATLPRASYDSVLQVVNSRMSTAYTASPRQLRLSVFHNDRPHCGLIRAREHDQLSVALVVSAHEILPRWVRVVRPWRSEISIEARAEQQIPGRRLAAN